MSLVTGTYTPTSTLGWSFVDIVAPDVVVATFLPGNQQVAVIRAGLVPGRYGEQGRDWPNATSTQLGGVFVQPYGTDIEAIADREFTLTHLRLWAPSDADVKATDRVIYNGETYEVDGTPAVWTDDNGMPDHIEISLKQMTG